MEKEKISIITIFLALLTIICTTACSFKGASSGQESKEEESGSFLSVDENLFWDFATDILALSKEESEKSYEYLRNDIF